MFRVKRIYEPRSREDGIRVLVDRLWPRGISKEEAALDEWMREIAPSDALRNWFSHREDRWDEFRRRYAEELDGKKELVSRLKEMGRSKTVTLLYSTKYHLNNALALKEYLESARH